MKGYMGIMEKKMETTIIHIDLTPYSPYITPTYNPSSIYWLLTMKAWVK